MWRPALVFFAVAVSGCSVAGAEGSPSENLGRARARMVGGSVSTSAQDATVFLMKGQDESCTGSLIAPNLILTARHCVAPPQGTSECASYGPTASPSEISVKVGVNADWESGQVVARGSKIFVPTTSNMCSYDVALIQTDRNINVKIAPVRFTPLEPNERTIAVGYGVDGNERDLPQRMQRSTTVLGVGPQKVSYKQKDGAVFDYSTPVGDVVTGESTCFGDSGGPLLDMEGRVVALTSRGPEGAPTGGAHGSTGCIDMLSVYAGVRFHEKLIRDAAQAAGHPLPTTDSTAPTPQGGPSEDTGDVDGASASGAEEQTEDPPPKKKIKPLVAPQPAACSAASPGAVHGNAWLALGGLCLALRAARRRRGGQRTSTLPVIDG